MRGYAAVVLTLLLAACASTPDIVDLGGGRLMITKSAMTGASGAGTIRADVLQLATDECRKTRRIVQMESQNESEPWYLPGNYHKLEIVFRCVPGPVN